MTARRIPSALLRALATGEVITLPDAGDLAAGATIDLVDGGPDVPPLKPAYGRWRTLPLADTWHAVVERIIDPAHLDPQSFTARHLLAGHPDSRIAILRVATTAGPVLSDAAFAARRHSVEAALR